MGYTRYWKRTDKDIDIDLIEFTIEVVQECKEKGIILCDGFGENEPIISQEMIWLNGNGKTGLDHETFAIIGLNSKHYKEGFEFCKTACKPYDYAVKKILDYAEQGGYVKDVSSDGENEEIGMSDADFLEKYKRYF